MKRTAIKALAGLVEGTCWGSVQLHPLVGYTIRSYGQARIATEHVHWSAPQGRSSR